MKTYKCLRLSVPAMVVLALSFSAAAGSDVAGQFQSLAQSNNESPQDWFALAQAARDAGELKIASNALDTAAKFELSPVRVGIERARIYVGGGHSAQAIAELEKVAALGFASVGVLTGDSVINSLAGQAGYDSLIATMSVQAYPCGHTEGFDDFDFWIGSWDIHVANGTLAGTNKIERQERGCVLVERWTNLSGGTGMSVNYLDKVTDEWVQIWNAEGGSQINVRGGLTPEGMRMEGHLHSVGAGTTVPFRALWTPLPDGRVRQFFEQSNDDGKSWVSWFEGFYSRTK